MLTSLEIENLKGIAARQRIDFAPLTLVFGPNSAGKSTILQALLYLHELVERGFADVDRTELGGHVLELGGFVRLVHGHDRELAIVLRAEFETPGGLERFGRDLADFPLPDLDDDVESAWLELTVRFRRSTVYHGAVVERAVIGVNGDREPLVWLEVGATLRDGEPLLARVNLGHPLLATESRVLPGVAIIDADGERRPNTVLHAPAHITEEWESIAIPEEMLRRMLEEEGGGGTGSGAGLGDGSGFGDGRSLPVFAVARGRLSALPAPGAPLLVIPFGDETPETAATAQQVRTFLEMVVLGTTTQLASFLRNSPYIGPLRTIPPRGYLYERPGRVASWSDGLAAWDTLIGDRLDLVERTNDWLRRLDAACKIVVQDLSDAGATAEEIAERHVDKTARRLLLDTGRGSPVLPSEVGAGVSQMVPVIVAALVRRSGLAMFEQPELHVHPAVQVGLGDLLIEAATADDVRRILLIETHSEHLILRVLRRIRETTDKELAGNAPSFGEQQLSVVYVEGHPDGAQIRRLRVDPQGEFLDRWPKGFFAERMKELM